MEGEDETVAVKRCTKPISAEAFDIFSQAEDSDSCGNSWAFWVTVVLCQFVGSGVGVFHS